MALDSGFVQVILAVCLLPLVVAGYWWRNVQISYRWIRVSIWHEDGQCDYLEWKGFVGGGDSHQRNRPIHICAPGGCAHSQHIPGDKCWKGTIDRFFNGSIQRKKIKKPSKLPVNQSFLCVDTKVIKAFILLAISPLTCRWR